MRVMVVGDPHVTADELPDCRELLAFVLKKCEETNTKKVLFLGDLFHTHAILHVEVLAFWNNCVEGLLDRGIESMALVGNHDRPGNQESTANALMGIHGLKVIDGPEEIEGVLFYPYTADHKKFVEVCQASKAKVLVCHQTFNGSVFENGFYAKDGIDPALIPQTVISGHIHAPQKFGNVWYPGAPRWRILSDANIDRFIYLMDIHEAGFLILDSFPTGDVCRRTHSFDISPESPDVPEGLVGDVRVDIRGPSSWVLEKKEEMQARGFKVRTFPVTEKKIQVRESDGVKTALRKFLSGFSPDNGTPIDLLLKTVEQRFEA